MSNPYAAYDMSPDKEKVGTYIEESAFRIRVARAGGKNAKYQSIYDAVTKSHRRAIQTETLPKDIVMALNAEIAAKALVTEWSINENFGKTAEDGSSLPVVWKVNSIHGVDGEVVEATVENITAVLIRYNDLYIRVAGHAGDPENYLNSEEIEANAGN